MHVVLIVGSELAARRVALDVAMNLGEIDERNITIIDVQELPVTGTTYSRRAATARAIWLLMVEKVAMADTPLVAVLADTHQRTPAGLECIVGTEDLVELARTVQDRAGTLSFVVLTDDVYASVGTRGTGSISEVLSLRHLQITHLQRACNRLLETTSVRHDLFLLALRGSATALTAALAGRKAPGAYLCYPINVFRRNPDHAGLKDLIQFRNWMSNKPIAVYDPLDIDEEHLISGLVGLVPSSEQPMLPGRRLPTAAVKPLMGPLHELTNGGEGLSLRDESWASISDRAKAQVPERDFFWIDEADLVVAWRPFLDGMHHAGVLSELQYALHAGKTVFAFSPPQDGGEHPSPFAAMIKPTRNWENFMSDVDAELKKITDLAAPEPLQRLPKYCDHTSVGVLIFNKAGELLLIDRGTFPFGMAPPAGHVDEHGSYEQAAIDEVREEVGLEVLDLELVAEGRVENPCRRVNGTWHYWKVYRATADGELNLSPRETRGAEWCDVPRLRELGALGVSEESEHLESVWKYWLNKVYATQGESNGHSR